MKTTRLLLAATIAKLSTAQRWDDAFFRAVGPASPVEDVVTPAPFSTASPGYDVDGYPENAAINAPLKNCLGQDTYLGLVAYADGTFDPHRCVKACDSKPDEKKPCVFFNAYILKKNGVAIAQHCALYSQAWSDDYATNVGQYRGSDHYTISNSITYVNSDDSGPCQPY